MGLMKIKNQSKLDKRSTVRVRRLFTLGCPPLDTLVCLPAPSKNGIIRREK